MEAIVEPQGLKPVAPPHASSGPPSPKRLRAGRRNPPKHTLLRSFGASKGTLLAFIHGLKTRGFLRRRVNHSALTGGAFEKILNKTFHEGVSVTLNSFQGLFLIDSEPSSE